MTRFIPVTAVLTVVVVSACNAKPSEKALPAADPAPVAKQVESPGMVTARAPTSAPRPPSSGDRFEGQPIDAAWAGQTTSAIEKALTVRLTPEQRALLGRIECRRISCTIDVNGATPDQVSSIWDELRKSVAKDVGIFDRISGVVRATDMKVDPPETYFLLQFDRDQPTR